MKAVELAVSQEDCWRKIAITLIDRKGAAGGLSRLNECNRLLTTVMQKR